MAIYAATLIIENSENLSDSQILEELKLFKLDSCRIGKENTPYQQCLIDAEGIYVTSTDKLIIITGLPVLNQCYRKQIPFSYFIKNSRFFAFLSDSTTMHHIICSGAENSYLRKKNVRDGNYVLGQKYSEIGNLFPEEQFYFSSPIKSISDDLKKENQSYLFGENDFDISLEIFRNNFLDIAVYKENKDVEEFFDTLIFNKNIKNGLSEEYLNALSTKLKRGEIKAEFVKFLSSNFKKLGYKKELYKAPAPRDIGKNLRFTKDGLTVPVYFEHSHLELTQESDLLMFLNTDLKLPVNLANILYQENHINLKNNFPFFSLRVLQNHRIRNQSNEKIFIKQELEDVFKSFSSELELFPLFESELTKSPTVFFTNDNIFLNFVNKIEKSFKALGINEYIAELNYCFCHIYFNNDIEKFNLLNSLFEKHIKNYNGARKEQVFGSLDKLKKIID